MNIYENLFSLKDKKLIKYSVLSEDETEDGTEWSVRFQLNPEEYDDSFEDKIEEIILVAVDIDAAFKYAEQYLRKMQMDSSTQDTWKNAEIISVDKM